MKMYRIIFLIVVLSLANGVDRSNFKTCDQSGFCKRHRNLKPGSSQYEVLLDTLQTSPSSLEMDVVNRKNEVKFRLQVFTLADNMVRLKINEKHPLTARYEVEYALEKEPLQQSLEVTERKADSLTAVSENVKIVIEAKPLRVDVYYKEKLYLSANSRGLLKFEHLRKRNPSENVVDDTPVDDPLVDGELEEHEPEPEPEAESEQQKVAPPVDTEEEFGMWEETFKTHHDSKPNGPESVGLDISFIDALHVYGIPQHGDSFALKETRSTDPYRLYNLDVFEYELDNPMALYGSIPMMLAHTMEHTVSMLWLNAAETWVDIRKGPDMSVISSLANFVSGVKSDTQMDTHWYSESGVIDIFFMLGPTVKDIFRQHASLTGVTPTPQLFSLGYHQSRWNYNDQEDVRRVEAGFDEHDLPLDVMWLDIEHTDAKKYFTWDAVKFPNSLDMINNLTAKGRRMVTIIDPHIKRDRGYFLHDDATSKGYYVKNKEGNDYDGWCWPGSSGYLDFFNPEVRQYWADQFALDKYHGSTIDLYTWNDMNEPSVFNGPEVTMHKDARHFGGWEHRHVHNLYGLLQHQSTFEGQLKRSDNKLRPFVLTRAHFSGTQRYAAVWTGDNTADWSHLRASIPMCLSLSVTGITFCGADVGGFFGNPDEELITRWYQAAAFQPFFRSHAHIDTKRREPWLFSQHALRRIREALRLRQSYLPYWYTLFYENEKTGMPPMKPLWVEYPYEKNTFTIEDEFLLGDALLVHTVIESNSHEVNVYFPGGDQQVWYDIITYEKFDDPGYSQIQVDLDKMPIYQRGGTIIPKKERIRRAGTLTVHDPYTLVVALDNQGKASGRLYIDDGQSYDYREGSFVYLEFNFSDNVLQCKNLEPNSKFYTKSWLERVVIVGARSQPNKVTVKVSGSEKTVIDSKFDTNKQVLVLRKPGVNIAESWSIHLV